MFKLNQEFQVFLPITKLGMIFHVKDDLKLEDFQRIMLEAVDEGYSVGEIEEALHWANSAVIAELEKLKSENYLAINQEGIYILTDLSKHFLNLANTIEKLNEDKHFAFMDSWKGNLTNLSASEVCDTPFDGLVVEGDFLKKTKFIVKDKLLEDDLEFYKEFLAEKTDMDGESIEKMLTEIFVVFSECKDQKFFKHRTFHHLPEVFWKMKVASQQPNFKNTVYCKNTYFPMNFYLNYPFLDEKRGEIDLLSRITEINSEYLSNKAHELLEQDASFQSYYSKYRGMLSICGNSTQCYAKTSEYARSQKPNSLEAFFSLPTQEQLSDEFYEKLKFSLREQFQIPNEYQIILDISPAQDLYLPCNYDDFWEELQEEDTEQ